jgi:hypothetical protein
MKRLLPVLFVLLPFLIATSPASAQGSPQKIQVIYHNVAYCPVSGMHVDGDHRKFEVIYTVGNQEHHIYLAGETYSKQFYNKPDIYLQKVQSQEASGEGSAMIVAVTK